MSEKLILEKDCTSSKAQRKSPSIMFWLLATMGGLFLMMFLVSVGMMTVGFGKVGGPWGIIAGTEHRSFLVWTNIELIRGYGVAAVGAAIIGYPMVRLWLKEVSAPTRWSIVWRSLVLWLLFLGYTSFRMRSLRPYVLSGRAASVSEGDESWVMLLRKGGGFFMLEIMPWLLVASVLLFYAWAFFKWLTSKGVRIRRITGVAVPAALMPTCIVGAALVSRKLSSLPVHPRGAPNILIIATDSLRADHLSCHSYSRATSPRIDALAADSIQFTRMMTPIASTVESMTSIMTSQYPHTHGLRHMYPSREKVDQMLQNSPQLPALLKQHGWRTTVMGDWCAGIFQFLPLGFEERKTSDFDDFRLYLAQIVYRGHFLIPLCFDNAFGRWMFPRMRSFACFGTAETVTGDLTQRLSQEGRQNQEKPFFITAFYSCTHFPYVCHPAYQSLFTDPKYGGRHRSKVEFNLEEIIRGGSFVEEFRHLPAEEVQQIRALYDGSVRFFDDQVGVILESLKENGLSDNTIVIITSDHGEDLFDPNTTIAHGWSFEGGDQTNHVPFILHLPDGRWKPREVSRITRTIDIAPTLLDLLGLPPEPLFEGCSLVPYASGAKDDLSLAFYGESSLLFFERQTPGGGTLAVPPLENSVFIDAAFDFHFVLKEELEDWVILTKERCLRTENWKLVFSPNQQQEEWRLFDLRTDPQCLQNVKEEFPEAFHALRTSLQLWIDGERPQLVREIFPQSHLRQFGG